MNDNRNRVAAVLAITSMLGFMAVVGFLSIGKVPPENKDFFNMALVALIGFCGTSYGYYLGSSAGSTQKNALLAQAMPTAPEVPAVTTVSPATADAGFARLRLLLVMTALGLILAMLCIIAGCATTATQPDNPIAPYATAARTLQASHAAIIVAGKTASELCTEGLMAQPACSSAATAYQQATYGWDIARDALVLALDQGDMTDYNAKAAKLQDVVGRLTALVASIKGGAH